MALVPCPGRAAAAAASYDEGNAAFWALYLVTAAPAPSSLGDRALADAA